jgi:hypothetical protein
MPRRRHSGPPSILVLFLALWGYHVLAPAPAAAYIDPLSGSLIFQAIAAGFVGSLVAFRRFRDGLLGWFRKADRSRNE